MFVGPVFAREVVTTPRRPRFFLMRTIYVAGLFLLMCTAWLVLAGTQVVRNVGDTARFGSILFQILAPLQLSLALFFSAMSAASAVSQEKDKKTLLLLLLTRMQNNELVLGKLFAALLNIWVMLLSALPLFVMMMLFGGVSSDQILRVYAVTFFSVLTAGSLGTFFSFWREKTFQTLALTSVSIVIWLAACEAVGSGVLGNHFLGISCQTWMVGGSPLRAVLSAARPITTLDPALGPLQTGVNLFLVFSLGATFLLNLVAIFRVRIWNPSQEVQQNYEGISNSEESIWGIEYDLQQATTSQAADAARRSHVDARLTTHPAAAKSRQVWDNPIVWREICTWAYGNKILFIRVAYLVLAALAASGLYFSLTDGNPAQIGLASSIAPSTTIPVTLFFLVSLVIVNALAVTSITNERDGRSLDLLLATDLTPKEFILGKLGGIFWVAKEMILAPLLLCCGLWWGQGISFESLWFLLLGLVAMNFFVAMLGIHYGMSYANSRTAISLSLGTVFFLFVGVATCILLMISFSGSFQIQLAPFLAFILGGSLGLYVTLGARNPSTAIFVASLLVPFMTFYAIVSFLLQYTLAVFLVTTVTYGFLTAALLIPAIYEFDFAMGRTTTPNE